MADYQQEGRAVGPLEVFDGGIPVTFSGNFADDVVDVDDLVVLGVVEGAVTAGFPVQTVGAVRVSKAIEDQRQTEKHSEAENETEDVANSFHVRNLLSNDIFSTGLNPITVFSGARPEGGRSMGALRPPRKRQSETSAAAQAAIYPVFLCR